MYKWISFKELVIFSCCISLPNDESHGHPLMKLPNVDLPEMDDMNRKAGLSTFMFLI